MKKNKIIFSPGYEWVDKLDITPPQPAKNFVPEWYKNLTPYLIKEHKSILNRFPEPFSNQGNSTAKMCVPILDSMTSGYILTMPCDVQFVDPKIYGHRILWEVGWEVISGHGEEQTEGIHLFLSDEFEPAAFKFQGLWNIKTPKGYSLLYTHPFWNYNVPFFTTTAIVDSDMYSERMNVPFFIKKDFIGTIEKDTPIVQIIPIKREKWSSEQQNFKNTFYPENIRLKSIRSYKNRFWQKKEYD